MLNIEVQGRRDVLRERRQPYYRQGVQLVREAQSAGNVSTVAFISGRLRLRVALSFGWRCHGRKTHGLRRCQARDLSAELLVKGVR
jgi:hypothetical protein